MKPGQTVSQLPMGRSALVSRSLRTHPRRTEGGEGSSTNTRRSSPLDQTQPLLFSLPSPSQCKHRHKLAKSLGASERTSAAQTKSPPTRATSYHNRNKDVYSFNHQIKCLIPPSLSPPLSHSTASFSRPVVKKIH